jgi:hypothetical protein
MTAIATHDPGKLVAGRARALFLVSIIATLALYVIPYGHYVGYPLVLISTVVHELGHGFTAWLVGGEFHKFVMYANAGGYAETATHSEGAAALVCAGGLVGPALGAMVSFIAARRAMPARACLGLFGAVLALAEVFVVRSLFGLVFVGALAVALLGLAGRGSARTVQLGLTLLGVQLALSVFSRGDYLFSRTAGGIAGNVSDVERMAQLIGGPYWFWGLVCGAFSLLALAAGGWYLIRGRRASRYKKKSGRSSESGTSA